jgi:hypothetical protein
MQFSMSPIEFFYDLCCSFSPQSHFFPAHICARPFFNLISIVVKAENFMIFGFLIEFFGCKKWQVVDCHVLMVDRYDYGELGPVDPWEVPIYNLEVLS